ncbi:MULTISPECIES: LuxR family transcriptional regulator [unclassified Mesorhizobium]|uniref:LuxR family transcriptional regulator n=1 Tax=unclassified Mesorhizobium TaxID=325217 RepID=UPI000BB08574|nr:MULTISPECIES: LuxR family transcriptional regulator [unclassified Mesorhizobium]TGT60220.1 autoinducer-binding protein [Mesorhizobium sp. M00.F.Ca.ET.170.01.1.1]AZO08385.1 autoinducer-binding protein [Mesorhizobium sp. M3A.F.Ca.ET.080.04.2.1]PBB84674.1 autoinducer-binding protein [Mesorhizobium sp. WSM3876]RWB72197.1 MAG: autoinducer-binding protein [Mesorhizobium sp.]RWB89401.1 MAG: autoinducer-binding protein [Mesorhizobium sp.]
MIDSDVFDFVERCRKHTATGPLLSDLLETVRNLGFEHLILSGVPLGGQKLAPMVELNGWPAGWFERYVEAEHAAVDGVCIYSAKTLKPFLWSEVPGKWSDTEASRRVAGEATEFGIWSGFAVPMLSVHHWQSVLSFASSAKSCKLSQREQGQLVTMAVYAGMTIQALSHDEDGESPLTDREREVLLWAAAGKTSSETSQILGLTERTVKWHAARAREAFGVATTTQAVVEAVRRRLIHP